MDWVKVLQQYRTAVTRDTKSPTSQPKQLNIQLSLLRSFVATISFQKKVKISNNLLAAAMHLAFLKSSVQNKAVIELPDKPLALAQRLVSPTLHNKTRAECECSILSNGDELGADELQFLDEFMKSPTGPGFAGL